jgi:lipopolysaccharide transport system permease protein
MSTYVSSVWRCRHFWLSLVKYDLSLRYRRSWLGIGWSLAQPIGMTCVLCLVFHRLLGRDLAEYAPYLLAGVSLWALFGQCVTGGCTAFLQAEQFIRQYPAPLAIYPLQAALGAMIHYLIASTVVIALTVALRGPGMLTALPALAPVLVILFVFCWGVAALCAVANAYFRDVQYITEIALQALFYLSPVIYPASMLHEKGLGWLAEYNPMAILLNLVRQPVLEGAWPPLGHLLSAAAIAAATAGCAALVLARVQRKLVFQL